MTLLKINRLLPMHISIVLLKFEVDIQSQSKIRVRKPKNPIWLHRWPFWKWHCWKSIGFCLWPPLTCIWNLKLKFQSKLDLCSGNHVVYRQTDGRTDGRTDKVNPVYPPSNFVGRGYNNSLAYRAAYRSVSSMLYVYRYILIDIRCIIWYFTSGCITKTSLCFPDTFIDYMHRYFVQPKCICILCNIFCSELRPQLVDVCRSGGEIYNFSVPPGIDLN